jgi:hypothetical protein
MMQSLRCLVLVVALALVAIPVTVAAQDQLGKVSFPTSCSPAAQADFERGVALLHSFWLDAGGKAFAAVAQADPTCAMAHWGSAMIKLGNPLSAPQPRKALEEGSAAIQRAKAANPGTARERGYIEALEIFYRDFDKVDHRTRALAYEKAMEQLSQRYADDREAAIFYALSLNMTALPTDKTYANQLKAASVLEKIFREQPQHPGVAHYLIHSYDYPPIAAKGLDAARRYAAIAPASPHARHMPSHVFTRVGAWQESIESNRSSAAVADQASKLHAQDYMVYGHLQLGQDAAAKKVLDEVRAIPAINMQHPLVFAAGYAIAAIPARYALERGQWAEAASLTLPASEFEWSKWPQAEGLVVFARALGASRAGKVATARQDLERLDAVHAALTGMKQGYWAGEVDVQRQIVKAWIARAEGKTDEAIRWMRAAADAEDATEKHIVSPGRLVPARELLGELLLEASRPADALAAFEGSQQREPNRLRGYLGAARAAKANGDTAKARANYEQLLGLLAKAETERAEIKEARAFLGR